MKHSTLGVHVLEPLQLLDVLFDRLDERCLVAAGVKRRGPVGVERLLADIRRQVEQAQLEHLGDVGLHLAGQFLGPRL